MSIGRIVLAAVVGGLVVFFWSFLSHAVLGLGEVGLSEMPNEEPVVASLRANLPASGLYFFPGMGGAESDPAAMNAWKEKLATGPSGILVYTAGGSSYIAPMQLVTELVLDILAALVAVVLLAKAWPRLPKLLGRAIFVAFLGLFAGLDIDGSYWNWYHFPASYTLAQVTDHVVGWFLAGLAAGALIKPRATAAV